MSDQILLQVIIAISTFCNQEYNDNRKTVCYERIRECAFAVNYSSMIPIETEKCIYRFSKGELK